VTWSTSNSAVASVSVGGLVTGETVGTATITATSEGEAGSTTVTVLAAPVASVDVTPLTASVAAGDTVRLTATPRDALGQALAGRTVTWTSSSDAVATVSTSGLVTGVAEGTVTITATSEGQNGTATVTVTVPPVAMVEVDPAAATLQVDDTQQLTAVPRDAGGIPLVGRSVTWSSSNALVASVTNTGLVTAHALGTATITATSEGQEGTSVITVTNTPPPPDNTAPLLENLTLEPDTADVSGGVDTVTITLHVTDATGVQSVTVNLRSPSMSRTLAVAVYEPSAGTRTDGTWLARIEIPTDAEEGNWTVIDVTLRDVNGNIRLLSTADLQTAGFPTSVYVRR
jgi:uncharacterized protein YjdB